MHPFMRRHAAILAGLTVTLTACGGGDSKPTDNLSKAGTTANGGLPVGTGGTGGTGAVTTAPVITVQPANATAQSDGQAKFSVVATGDGLSYQWRKNGMNIAGATSASYTAPSASLSDQGAQYSVVVSNAGGTVTSLSAQVTLALSANQQAFEDLNLAPSAGSHLLHWNLPYSGNSVSGINYAYSDVGQLAVSPLNAGPQTVTQSAARNLTATLALPTIAPTRVLKNGVILVVPNAGISNRISYVGGDVRVDTLAADKMTVAFSELRSDFVTVPLTGLISATPADFAQFHNSFFSNPAILDGNASYAAGASYLKFKQTNYGDRYNVFDCNTATTGAAVSTCKTNTTLTSAMTAGMTSNSDGVTYRLADGVTSVVNGVPMWVANKPRPQSATLSSTVQYRIYFEMGGNLYTGALIKDSTVLGGSYYVSNPLGTTTAERLTFLPFDIRMNKAAHDSLLAAMKL